MMTSHPDQDSLGDRCHWRRLRSYQLHHRARKNHQHRPWCSRRLAWWLQILVHIHSSIHDRILFRRSCSPFDRSMKCMTRRSWSHRSSWGHPRRGSERCRNSSLWIAMLLVGWKEPGDLEHRRCKEGTLRRWSQEPVRQLPNNECEVPW